MKKNLSLVLLFAIAISLIPIFPSTESVADAATTDQLLGPSVSPAGPVTSQTMKTPVEAYARTEPGVFWTQMDNKKFRASEYIDDPVLEQIAITEKGGTRFDLKGNMNKDYPAENSKFRTIIDSNKYKPGQWKDKDGKTYASSNVTSTKLNKNKMKWVVRPENQTYKPAPPTEDSPGVWPGNDMWIVHYTYTGGPNWTSNERYGDPGNYKFVVSYATPMDLWWDGEVKQTKTMRMTPMSVSVNQSKNMVAEVETTGYGAVNWTSVSARAENWNSSNTAVATVDSKGKVTGKKAGTTVVSAEWKSGLYHLKASATVTVVAGTTPPDPEPTPEPQPYEITGNFDILPDQTIEWRDTFTFRPRDFVISAQCTYQKHHYLIERDGNWSRSNNVTSRTADTVYPYSSYPDIIGIGVHQVSLKIFAKCDGKDVETGWLGTKDLIVNGPVSNSPPYFNAGWFEEYDRFSWDAPWYVVVNKKVNLRIINKPYPVADPAEPYDPDGDPITYTWDFANSKSSWVQSLPEKYGLWLNDEMHTNILAEELGQHCARVTARDPFGAAATRNVCVQVIPENPIPMIDGPYEVVEGRPLPRSFDGSRSFSPIKRSIVKYDWTNVHERYYTPGQEVITLEVTDSGGLKSEAPASHTLTVKEDLPPVPKLDFDNTALRTTPVVMTNNSYSPDNDIIVENLTTYRYDSNNDGSFEDETSIPVDFDENDIFIFNPPRIGNYRFHVYVKEDWGKEAQKDFDLKIVNDNPQTSFTVSGEIEQPPGALPDALLPNQLLGSTWKTSNFNGDLAKRFYRTGNELVSGITHTQVEPVWPVYPHEYLNKESRYFAPTAGAEIRAVDFDELLRAAFGEEYTLTTKDNGVNAPYNSRYTHQMRKNGVIEAELNSPWSDEYIRGLGSYSFITDGRLAIYNYSGQLCSWNSSDGTTGTYGGTNYNYFYYNPSTNKVVIWNGQLCDSDGKYNNLSYVTGDPEFKVKTSYVEGSGNVYYIARMIGPTEAYSVSLPRDAVEYRVGYSTAQVLPKVFPVSTDGNRMAHLEFRSGGNTYLIIRNNTTGGKISEHLVYSDADSDPSSVKVLHYALNRIVINYGSTIEVYDFNGNKVWGKTLSAIGIGNITRFSSSAIASKDGKVLWIDQTGSDSNFKLYYKSLNLLTGAIDQSVELGSYDVGHYYYRGPVAYPPRFMDDGKVFLTYGAYTDSYDCYGCRRHQVTNKVVDGPGIIPEYSSNLGQFYSTSKEIINAEFQYALKLPKTFYKTRESAGLSFRMTDNRNMYRVETTNYHVRIVKVVDGNRTILKEISRDSPPDVWTNYKVRVVGKRIKVYINGVPLVEVIEDSPPIFGYYGPYANREYVSFKDMSVLPYEVDMMDNVALVDESVEYETSWSDPENDPQLKERTTWDFEHIDPNKFLNAGDGKSGLSSVHGKTVDSPILSFDRVGLYKITYRGSDDPHPDYKFPSMTFDAYRQFSDDYWQNIAVHRRPIAQFTLSIDPGTKKVVWNDTSYDPDRWLNPTNYSSEATGIDYKNSRGITKRVYYSISPSGEVSDTQLISPREAGVYTVGEAVRDEYNAWSEWYIQAINITQPIIDEPPIPGFTLSKTTLSASETLTITSTAWDKEDGPAENLPHQYFIRNLTTGTAESLQSTDRGTWTKSFSSLGEFEIRQVVRDSVGQTAQLIKRVQVVNTPPVANFDWTPKPAWEGDTVHLINQSTDADGDTLSSAWVITGPNGYYRTSSETNPSFSDTANRPGVYSVQLTVRDPIGASDTITKPIVVGDLTIEGQVLHTADWEEYRLKWNATNPTKKRDQNVFWAGEAFVLASIVTDTGPTSTTKPLQVVAQLLTRTNSVVMTTTDRIRFTGEMLDIGFAKTLKDGPYTMRFTVNWSNGVVDSVDVPIIIRGNINDVILVHNRH